VDAFKVGVDVGGTFTDFVLLDHQTGQIHLHKELTTPGDPAEAIISGLLALFDLCGVRGDALTYLVHGTTLVANAIIERKGARTALLTTRGVRDILQIGREVRYDINDRLLLRPEPLVSRAYRVEVDERLLPSGDALVPLDVEQVRAAVRQLLADGVESLAVVFLHAYRSAEHEQKVRALVESEFPGLFLSLSSEVAPEIREYERTSTTCANAYVQPIVLRYLRNFRRRLEEFGYRRDIFLMLSDGSIATDVTAGHIPIRLVESGPAGGVLGAKLQGSQWDRRPNLLSFDMGGTTAKLSVIDDGVPHRSVAMEVAQVSRSKRGSGIPLMVPAIEMIEIGAGGGSIAWVDRMGLLKVGPSSAGANPGPACYGRGGREPTVTDACLVLGYIDPDHFLGGRMRLDAGLAKQAIAGLTDRLGLRDPVLVASGIYEVVSQNMANAARVYLSELGRDARRYTMVAFGGAGPMFATKLARTLKLRRLLIPKSAGAFSALGFLSAPVAFEQARTHLAELGRVNWMEVRRIFDDLRDAALRILGEARIPSTRIRHLPWLEMRYRGQKYQIDVPVDVQALVPGCGDEILRRFVRRYKSLYKRVLDQTDVEIISCRLRSQGPVPTVKLVPPLANEGQGEAAKKANQCRRPAYFAEMGGLVECMVYDWQALWPGDNFAGPAIVEETNSTVVLGPGCAVRVDETLGIRVELDS